MTRHVCAVVLLVSSALAGAPAQQPPAEDEVDRYVLAEMTRQRIPGLSLAIVEQGRLVKARGYGLANVELDVPATEQTIYQSGSVGKQFTAAAVLLLAEDGKLSLDGRITQYFSKAPASWRNITIRHLLTHTSGIKNYTDEALDLRRDYTDDQLVGLALKAPLDFAPGTRWSYSNTGYVLLGIIVTRVSGRFYGDVLADRVFGPLGMTTARIISEADIVRNRADGYRLVAGELKNQEWVSPKLNTTADGSLYLTVLDLAKWDAALAGTQFLSAASRHEWWTPVKLSGSGSYPYGMGWDVDYQLGHRSAGHGGSWQGFKTHIQRYPDDGVTVVVLANLAQARQSAIAYAVAGICKPALIPPHRMAAQPANDPMATRLRAFVDAYAAGGGRDSSLTTPGFAAVVTPESRKQATEMLKAMTGFTFVGCDDVAALNVERHGAAVARYCYAKVELSGAGRAMTFWLTKDDRVAGFTTYAY
jgi:CubicO group peptidase (beta-lactamase class C family)